MTRFNLGTVGALWMMEKGEQGCPSTLVMVAALNEEEGIGSTLVEIKDFLDMPLCLVVDGRSTDGTVRVAKDVGAQIVFQKGSGKGDAIAAGIAHARGLDVKYVVFIDADFTYPAEFLPRMIEMLEENPNVGMISGNRFNHHFHFGNMPNIFYTGNRLIASAHNLLNGVQMRDPLTGLRVVRWEILKDWKPQSKGFDVEVEMNHHVERKGYGILELPIYYRARVGKKKLKLRHGFTILRRILAEALS